MRDREVLDRTTTPDGKALTLTRETGHFVVRIDGTALMSSAAHHSEEQLAEVGCFGLAERPNARVLVGGLGMGFTLRAALDRLGPTGRVVVVELLPAIVAWNRGPLGPLSGHPLADPRVSLVEGDLVKYVGAGRTPFDAILLDVDNGPAALTVKGNRRLYDDRGLHNLRRQLKPGGLLVVWSADQHPPFVEALARAGFEPKTLRVRSRGRKGSRQTIYMARRSDDADGPRPAAAASPPPGRRRPS